MRMKKMSLFALAFAISAAVFAQDAQPQLRTPMTRKTHFGLDVGVNLAKLSASDFTGTEPTSNGKTAFHVATFVNIPLAGIVSLKPQLMYSKQGGKIREGNVDFEEDLDYLYVAPAALNFTTPGGFVFETGPMLGFLLGASRENQTNNTSADIKDRRKPIDVLWSGGIGYMTRSGLGAHARYNYGFTNVRNVDEANMRDPGTMRNRVIQIGLMYHFGGHK
jgi:hypothetical protein